MVWIGLLAGAFTGALVHGFAGMLAGALVGVVIGSLLRASRQAVAPRAGAQPSGVTDAAIARESALAARITALETRLASLEKALADAGIALPRGTEAQAASDAAAASAEHGATALQQRSPVADAAPTAQAAQAAAAAREAAGPSLATPVRKGGARAPNATMDSFASAGVPPSASFPRASAASSVGGMLWAWFTSGNAIVRVGVIVLFFGIAFLLSYFAEHFTLPIELKFAGVALLGAAMMALGARLQSKRPAYALALVGGGCGVLYLTTFSALQLVPLLTPEVAFTLLAAIALLSVILALRFDSQALAALAAFGGFVAPVLVATERAPALLFGYMAAVNVVVLGVAWFRTWRVLNLVGFVLTFVCGLWWGWSYYQPTYFATVEPFLVLFFVAYLALPLLNTLHDASKAGRLDAMLIFGVPMVAFALQATLVYNTRYGLAWSAGVVAAIYGVLWFALRHRRETVVATLAAAHGALAVIFATLTVPLAVDARWTSATWAVEAVGVYWIGCKQEARFARGFALLLQLGTGIMFLLAGLHDYGATAFFNRQFLGMAAIALSALATVHFGDRSGERLPAGERALLPLVFGWGCAWWLGGGLLEIRQHLESRLEAHAMLAWVIGSVTAALALTRALRWPRLDIASLVLLPAIAVALGHDFWNARTSLSAYGWLVYPTAWALHFMVLLTIERRLPVLATDAVALRDGASRRQWLLVAHTAGALLLLGQIAWEAGEWTARITDRDTVWAACAHLAPLALYLLAVTRAAPSAVWPLRTFADAYVSSTATIVAVALAVGFLALAVLNPGNPSPLPYVPVLNPLDLTLALALAAMFAAAKAQAQLAPLTRYRGLGVGSFIAVNGVVIRTVHHWMGVPWRVQDIVASKPLQAALTLTWTLAALSLMVAATQRRVRALWLVGAGLLAVVVVKLFVVDLAALSGLTRVIAFLGVGVLLLLVGYVAPLPPVGNADQPKTG